MAHPLQEDDRRLALTLRKGTHAGVCKAVEGNGARKRIQYVKAIVPPNAILVSNFMY
jgi:hypothetical protein